MNTIKKIIIFLILVFSFLYLVDQLPIEDQNVSRFKSIVESTDSHSIAFVGSSRTMRGINPILLDSLIRTYKSFNLGISGSTFVSNYLVTNYLIEKSRCGIIIFELSPIISDCPNFTHRLTDYLNIDYYSSLAKIKGNDSGSNFRFKIEVLNDIVSKKLFIKQKVKRLFRIKSKSPFGYFEEELNLITSDKTILKSKDLLVKSSNFDLSMYKNVILDLITSAREHNKKLIFRLPLTFRKEDEKLIIIPLYHQIPNENKLIYDDRIVQTINKPELLFDSNHFNAKGAKVVTNEIARLLNEQAIINSSLLNP